MMNIVSFANPWFLLGIITIGIPIWLHLLYKKIPKLHNFSSIKLIKISTQAIQKKTKLKNLLLLILRIFILLLITFSFAKPYLGSSFGNVSYSNEPTAFVVILDNSMSMGVVENGIQYFQLAKSKAMDILNLMGNLDKGSIIILNEQANIFFPQLTWNMDEIKEIVKKAELSYGATNLAIGLINALEILSTVKNYKKIIYLITDLCKKPFEAALENKVIFDKIKTNNIELIVLPVGDKVLNNAAITNLTIDKPFLIKNIEANILVTVSNFGNSKIKTNLSLYLQNNKKRELALELDPKSHKKLELPISFDEEGYKEVTVSITADSLPLDDKRFLYIPVLPPQKVLIVKNSSSIETRQHDDDLFLRFAINPLNRVEKTEYIVESRSVEDALSLHLNNYASIFLVNIRRFPPDFINKLYEYITSEGFCGIFLGDNVEPEYYNSVLLDSRSNKYILPARLHKRIGNAVNRKYSYHLTDINYMHHSFAIFEAEGSGDPKRANFWEFFQTSPNPNSYVLAKMSHGLPAIVEEKIGDGYVMLFTFTSDTKWTNWPLKATFLPFLHQTISGYIAKKGILSRQLRPNQILTIPVNLNEIKEISLNYSINQNEIIYPTTNKMFSSSNNNNFYVRINRFSQPGFYKLTQKFINNNIKEDYFVVNTIPEESDLDKIKASDLPNFIKTIIPKGNLNTSISSKIIELKEGKDISSFLLTILILFVILESLIATNFFELISKKTI